MEELAFGFRVSKDTGLRFIGLETLNQRLRDGNCKIVEIVPGDTVMHKVGEDDEHVRLTFGGCDFIAKLADDLG